MTEVVIKGGTVLDKTGSKKADIAIGSDGNIAQIGEDIAGKKIIDATGCIVTSGLIDLGSKSSIC